MTPANPSPRARDDAARTRLLKAALDLFDRKGYAATTVREIVEAAGVTKPVLYYYFGNKEGIYLALVGEAFRAFMATLSEARKRSGPTRERVMDLCGEVYDFTSCHLPLIRVMYGIYYGPPQGAPPFDFDETHQVFQEIVREFLEEGIRRGEVRSMPAEEAMWAVLGALNIAIGIDLCHPDQSLGVAGVRRTVNLIFDGLAAAPPNRKRERP